MFGIYDKNVVNKIKIYCIELIDFLMVFQIFDL